MFKYPFLFLCLITACLLPAAAHAQIGSLFGGLDTSNSDPNANKGPTTIKFDEMNADDANNIVTFTGNVDVDGPQMKIKCHKMIVFLIDVKKEGEEPAKASETKPGEGGKDVEKIICLGDVLIIRKSKGDSDEKGEQKAIAGKADYNIKTGKIILTDKPVIFRGEDKLAGSMITIYRDSDRMDVRDGKILMNSTTPDAEDSADSEKISDKTPVKATDKPVPSRPATTPKTNKP